ncbi:ABC transporter ATP-binding protein (plasmid) [Haloferax prahovense]|uniref:ABC transporter ATP-binding protein n=1 Tax=Haloferax prahovense TaxID=381852 RepID=UPI003C70C51A
MATDLIRIRDLSTRFFTQEGQVNAVEDVSLSIEEGELYGIVGESGSGKSVLGLSIIDLIESPGRITGGEIWYRNPEMADDIRSESPDAVDGEFVELRSLPAQTRRSLRGRSFSMVFQDPMASMNPSLTVGTQIAEAVEAQRRARANPLTTRSKTESYGLSNYLSGLVLPRNDYVRPESRERAVELLEQVGIPDPADRAKEYPNQFSGGMLQRAMIAQALAGEPDLLIADEPTTALDVTIQAQIIELLEELQQEKDMSIMMITHNLGLIAHMCDRVGVMYAGEIVERGTLEAVFDETVHPYTEGLLGSVPSLDHDATRLDPIGGNVPSLLDSEMGGRCYFVDRCPNAMEQCYEKPPEYALGDEHAVQCYLAEEQSMTTKRREADD